MNTTQRPPTSFRFLRDGPRRVDTPKVLEMIEVDKVQEKKNQMSLDFYPIITSVQFTVLATNTAKAHMV